jgi:hypothetical protein
VNLKLTINIIIASASGAFLTSVTANAKLILSKLLPGTYGNPQGHMYQVVPMVFSVLSTADTDSNEVQGYTQEHEVFRYCVVCNDKVVVQGGTMDSKSEALDALW